MIFTMAAALAAIVASAQWHFKLDTTFRTQITQQNTNSILLLPDGKLIASGIMRFPGEFSDKRLVRLLPDGTRDESFYSSGLGGGKIEPWQPDRFYVQGTYTPRRIWSDTGLNDGSFALGSGAIPYFLPGSGGDYHVFDDGRVLITGNHTLSDSIRGFVGQYKLIWFSNEGYLDTTRIHRQANGVMWNFTALPDGKFLCSCSCTMYDGQPVGRVFRIHADGALDTSFVSDIAYGSIISYHPLEDGRVYLGGKFRRAPAPADTLWLVRLLPDGSIDQSFSLPNFHPGSLPNPSSGAWVEHIHPWHNGTLIIGGRYRYVNGSPRNSICLIDSTGNVLAPFHEQGIGTYQWAVNTYSDIADIIEDDQGRLYIAGAYTGYSDGTINDALQRFVSRLLVEEVNVAIQEEENSRSFSTQPNPTNDQVTFTFDPVIGRSGSITIRDIHGRELARLPIREGTDRLEWSAADLAPGIYVVSLGSGGSVSTQKLVVN